MRAFAIHRARGLAALWARSDMNRRSHVRSEVVEPDQVPARSASEAWARDDRVPSGHRPGIRRQPLPASGSARPGGDELQTHSTACSSCDDQVGAVKRARAAAGTVRLVPYPSTNSPARRGSLASPPRPLFGADGRLKMPSQPRSARFRRRDVVAGASRRRDPRPRMARAAREPCLGPALLRVRPQEMQVLSAASIVGWLGRCHQDEPSFRHALRNSREKHDGLCGERRRSQPRS